MRIARVRVSSRFLLNIFTEGHEIHAKVVSGLPEGAVFLYSIPTIDYIFIDFVFEHPSFDMVEMGQEIPRFREILVEKL